MRDRICLTLTVQLSPRMVHWLCEQVAPGQPGASFSEILEHALRSYAQMVASFEASEIKEVR